MDIIKTILEIIKLPVKIIIGILFFSGLLLIIPDFMIIKFQLDWLINDYGKFIGVAFLCSFIIILVNIIFWLIKFIKNKFIYRKLTNEIKISLTKLDPHEKAVIREFFIQGKKNTIELPINNSTVAGLIRKNIIQIIGNIGLPSGSDGLLFPVSLTKITSENLKYKDMECRQTNKLVSWGVICQSISRLVNLQLFIDLI